VPRAWRSNNIGVAAAGVAAAALLTLGAALPSVLGLFPSKPATARDKAIGRANNLCPSMWAMRPVAKLPKGIIFTFVDLAPRVITITHHDAVAGPYHRNGPAIADSMNAFQGDAAQAHALIAKHRANYVMTCPDMSQATVFMARAPKGFYAQLLAGRVPGWLQPIPLPKDNPLRMWRVVG
jgi:hypothetical protein